MSREELDATPPLEECLAAIIAEIITDKEKQGILPPCATTAEILARLAPDAVKAALNALERSGLLTFRRTLNDVAFSFTPPK